MITAENALLSEKDAKYELLKDFDSPFNLSTTTLAGLGMWKLIA